jgi:hypothetical protein
MIDSLSQLDIVPTFEGRNLKLIDDKIKEATEIVKVIPATPG